MDPLRANGDRLWDSLMEMAKLGATPAGGSRRLALTAEDAAGRDLFVRWCRDAGCDIAIDQLGNIFARRRGSDPSRAPVAAGSHLDTQPHGGKFDGVFGVLAALEVVRTLNEREIETLAPVEIVMWTNEEGARFAPAMLGSGVFAGAFELDYGLSRADSEGVTVGEALAQIGYAGSERCGEHPLECLFEAHIEQGFRRVAPKWLPVFLGNAAWHYETEEFPVLQAFWPDPTGHFPWQPGADQSWRGDQPCLHQTATLDALPEAMIALLRREGAL